jgi:hypothetical protein
VVVVAVDDSERALREAKALTLELEDEIYEELVTRHKERSSALRRARSDARA